MTITANAAGPRRGERAVPDLSVTVSQTKDLVAQGIRLDYSGGVKSSTQSDRVPPGDAVLGRPQGRGRHLVLDKNGQPQPDRTTCQWGNGGGGATQSRDSGYSADKAEFVAAEDAQYAAVDPLGQTYVSIPFRAVTARSFSGSGVGEVIYRTTSPTTSSSRRSRPTRCRGSGSARNGCWSVTFEVQTNAQAPGLGCGAPSPARTAPSRAGPAGWSSSRAAPRTPVSRIVAQEPPHRRRLEAQARGSARLQALGVRCVTGAAEKCSPAASCSPARSAPGSPVSAAPPGARSSTSSSRRSRTQHPGGQRDGRRAPCADQPTVRRPRVRTT